ncbi:FMN-linked oxidoreductase [Dendrothele bispora CBS 962.96]|uniref:FMN-linked oxidoreductase n=1 Tax=Dendrothele bispora (strain CBS 962.96) TaxID=1314807 RepID=A0A4S8M7X5_DENBC|nr:FMN-linked oxidoreductase [Dendrothele bispora CBS 962.96]
MSRTHHLDSSSFPSVADPNSLLSTLFTPLPLSPQLTLRNKFLMAALTRDRSVPTNVPTDLMIEYYRQRAKGGASLIVSEGVLVSRQGTSWPHAPGIWSEEQVAAWKKITDAVHEEGAVMFAQLWHVGRISHIQAPEQIASGEPIYAPSAIASRDYNVKFRFIPGEPSSSVPTAVPDPHQLIQVYKHAALSAKRAGFDGVEVHTGGGYLIHEFLDNTANKREDEWGGSVENRARFGLEVLRVVREVFGPGRVGIKLTPAGWSNLKLNFFGFGNSILATRMSLEDTIETFTYFITEADKLDLAFMMFSRYSDEVEDPIIDGKRRATKHDMIETYRSLLKNSKFFVVGNCTPLEAAELISSNKVDGVFFGRPWIANPDLPNRVKFGLEMNETDVKRLYGARDGSVLPEEELAKGYTDYPLAVLPDLRMD